MDLGCSLDTSDPPTHTVSIIDTCVLTDTVLWNIVSPFLIFKAKKIVELYEKVSLNIPFAIEEVWLLHNSPKILVIAR